MGLDQITALALIWTWHFIWLLLLTYAVGRAAHTNSGWFICRPKSCRLHRKCRCKILVWPISGRWLLTALFLMITLMVGDVAHVAWKIALNDYPNNFGWNNVILRAAPILLEPWTFFRQWRRGLTNDY